MTWILNSRISQTYIFIPCSEIPHFTYRENKIVVPLGYQAY